MVTAVNRARNHGSARLGGAVSTANAGESVVIGGQTFITGNGAGQTPLQSGNPATSMTAVTSPAIRSSQLSTRTTTTRASVVQARQVPEAAVCSLHWVASAGNLSITLFLSVFMYIRMRKNRSNRRSHRRSRRHHSKTMKRNRRGGNANMASSLYKPVAPSPRSQC